VDNPLAAIDLILSRSTISEQREVWFTHGLPSILLLTTQEQRVNKVGSAISQLTRASECWHIQAGTLLGEPSITFSPATAIAWTDFDIGDPSGLPDRLQDLHLELSSSVGRIVHRSAQFLPSHLPTLRAFCREVSELFGTLRMLWGIEPPHTPQAGSENESEARRQQRINHITGLLVQANAALSYVFTQAFTGTPPILTTEPPVSTWSLLGIGTAYCALRRFVESVEAVFSKAPIGQIIQDEYRRHDPIPVISDLTDYHRSIWKTNKIDLNHALEDTTPKRAQRCKISFFSGRLGFSETGFTVTAALETMTAGHTPTWSLLTLSHELIHAHVRGLLSSLLNPNTQKTARLDVLDAYRRFLDLYFQHDPKSRPHDLLESIQFNLLAYCNHRANYRELGRSIMDGRNKADARLVDMADVRTLIADGYRDLNEMLVHVLDFNYFYHAQPQLYLRLIWESWAAVPMVLDDLPHYLLRSIVTIATQIDGYAHERYDTARTHVLTVCRELHAADPNNIVAKEAVACLEDESCDRRLSVDFIPAIFLADIALRFLVASSVRAHFFDDDNIDAGDDALEGNGGRLVYRLPPGSFSPPAVPRSPAALVHDQLRRQLEGDHPTLDRHHHAAWLMLACASCQTDQGEPNHVM
jgi:hypothetical protein